MKQLLLSAVLCLAFSSVSMAQESEKQPLGPGEWPTTVQAAVAALLTVLPDSEKEIIRNTKESDLIQFHHGWGTGIRNHYGLWRGNNALREDACGKGCHPDDASMVIITAVWKSLQSEG